MAAAKRETGASMEYSDFIIFADESGDVGVKSIDPNTRFSCLAAASFAGKNTAGRHCRQLRNSS